MLGLVVSDMLFRAFPKADEGELSRRLADLVRKETCADVARAIDLGAAIRLGVSEANAGGRRRTAILADVCEALIGAVFVDGGYRARPSADRAALGASACSRRRGRCAIRRPCCRNGRRRAACRRRPIARWSAPGPGAELKVRVVLGPGALDLAIGRRRQAARLRPFLQDGLWIAQRPHRRAHALAPEPLDELGRVVKAAIEIDGADQRLADGGQDGGSHPAAGVGFRGAEPKRAAKLDGARDVAQASRRTQIGQPRDGSPSSAWGRRGKQRCPR